MWEIVFWRPLWNYVSRQPEFPQHVLFLLQPNVDDANHVVGGSPSASSTPREDRFFATTNIVQAGKRAKKTSILRLHFKLKTFKEQRDNFYFVFERK